VRIVDSCARTIFGAGAHLADECRLPGSVIFGLHDANAWKDSERIDRRNSGAAGRDRLKDISARSSRPPPQEIPALIGRARTFPLRIRGNVVESANNFVSASVG